ncbi:MAG: hypothetical protein KJ718_04085 [Nanoarchaeota archaeon]|nr:hypothetical protein [Nanoarchaeota archaeon]MBU1051708.1 hypothetical protein [Nanoarchaeota archaeon]
MFVFYGKNRYEAELLARAEYLERERAVADATRSEVVKRFSSEVSDGDAVRINFERTEETKREYPNIDDFDFVGVVKHRRDSGGIGDHFYYLGNSREVSEFCRIDTVGRGSNPQRFMKEGEYSRGGRKSAPLIVHKMVDFKVLEKYQIHQKRKSKQINGYQNDR